MGGWREQTAEERDRRHKNWVRLKNESQERWGRQMQEEREQQAVEDARKAETKAAAESPSEFSTRRMQASERLQRASDAYAKSPYTVPATQEYRDALLGARDVADVALRVAQFRANQDTSLAVRQAGNDPVARSKAHAAAVQKHATALGQAERDLEDARLAYDRGVVQIARNCKIASARIREAQARYEEMQKADTDVLRLSNPFADPVRPKITQSQFDSIKDPALRARAGQEAEIIDDVTVKFTKEEALFALGSYRVGSNDRVVLTMSEFNAIEDPAERMHASQTAILIDDVDDE